MTQGWPTSPEPVLRARLRREPSARTNSDRAAHPEEAHSGAEGRLEGLARIANRIVNCLPAVGGRSRR